MGGQKIDADELWLQAEANGYARGAHTEIDRVRGGHKYVSKTKKDYDRTLQRYTLWHLKFMRDDHKRKGLPLPDENAARSQYLGPGVPAPDLVTVKDFLRFYIATSRPQLEKGPTNCAPHNKGQSRPRPTADAICTVVEWFFAGFTRVTGTDTQADDRSEVYYWIRRTLVLEGLVVNKHRPKHNFTVRDLTRVLLALWTPSVKNNRDPDNIVFGAPAKEHQRLFYNDAGFLLAMAIADGALFGYDSLEDVRQQVIPAGKDELILRFKDSALEQPILRKCTKTGEVTGDPMPRSTLGVREIIAADIVESKLALAASLGATCQINSASVPIESALRDCCPQVVDFIVDTTRLTDILNAGISALAHEGCCAMAGVPRPQAKLQIDALDLLMSCKQVVGVIEGSCDPQVLIPKLLQLHKDGLFPIDRLYKTYPVSQLHVAIDDMKSGKSSNQC